MIAVGFRKKHFEGAKSGALLIIARGMEKNWLSVRSFVAGSGLRIAFGLAPLFPGSGGLRAQEPAKPPPPLVAKEVRAADLKWTAGVRSGFSASSFNDPFVQAEAFASWTLPQRLPWHLESSSGWYTQVRIDLTSGWLHGRVQREEGWVGTLGPGINIGKRGFPLALDLGSSPTGLSRSRFGTTDFGVQFQFTTHVGITCDLGRRLVLGYRAQHMSNAHISGHNPGLDLHAFSLGWRF